MEVTVSGYRPDYHCLIVGAGFAGIGFAIKLKQAGFTDFVILDEADGPAGSGTGTPIPVSPWTFRRSATNSRSSSDRTGPEATRGCGVEGHAEDCVDKSG